MKGLRNFVQRPVISGIYTSSAHIYMCQPTGRSVPKSIKQSRSAGKMQRINPLLYASPTPKEWVFSFEDWLKA